MSSSKAHIRRGKAQDRDFSDVTHSCDDAESLDVNHSAWFHRQLESSLRYRAVLSSSNVVLILKIYVGRDCEVASRAIIGTIQGARPVPTGTGQASTQDWGGGDVMMGRFGHVARGGRFAASAADPRRRATAHGRAPSASASRAPRPRVWPSRARPPARAASRRCSGTRPTVTMRPGWVTEQNLTFINLSARDHARRRAPTRASRASAAAATSARAPWCRRAPPPTSSTTASGSASPTGAPFGLVTKPRQTLGRRGLRPLEPDLLPGLQPGHRLQGQRVALGRRRPEHRVLPPDPAPGAAGPGPAQPGRLPSSFLKGDSWGVGFTAGALITPCDGTALGVGYRSSVHHDIDGSIGVPLVALAPLGRPGQGEAQHAREAQRRPHPGDHPGGPRQPRLRVGQLVDGSAPSASSSKAPAPPVNALPLNYKDGYTYSIGGEYDWSPALTVRAGVAYEISPIDFSNRSVRLPDGDRVQRLGRRAATAGARS